MIPNRREVYNQFKKYPPRIWNRTGPFGTNSDIIKTILSDHKRAVEQAILIAPMFKGPTPEQTAKNVYDFLFNQIIYVKDPSGQDIKLPSALVRTGQGDCKSNSLFANSLFDALNIPFAYRFASYDSNPVPTHVYSYIAAGENKIIADPVWKKFNSEKPFVSKKDFTKKNFNMRIRSIQGGNNFTDYSTPLMGLTSHTDIGKTTAKKTAKKADKAQKKTAKKAENTQKKAVKTAAKTKKKAVRKEKVKVAKEKLKAGFKNTVKKASSTIKKAGKIVKKGALTPVRTSFLALLRLNFRGLATKIAKVNAKDPAAIKNIWEKKFAGSYAQFVKQLDLSKNKKPFLGAKKVNGTISGPEAIIAVIAAATPLLIAFIGLLKAHGEDPGEMQDVASITEEAYAEAGGNAAMDDMADQASGSGGSSSSGGGSYDGGGSYSPGNGSSAGAAQGSGDSDSGSGSDSEQDPGQTKSGNGMLILAAAGLAAVALAGGGKKSKSK